MLTKCKRISTERLNAMNLMFVVGRKIASDSVVTVENPMTVRAVVIGKPKKGRVKSN